MTPEQVYTAWQNREPVEPVQLARALRAALDEAATLGEDANRWRCVLANPFAAVDALRAHVHAKRADWVDDANRAIDQEREKWARP